MERENMETGRTADGGAGREDERLSKLRLARLAARGCANLLEALSAFAGQSLRGGGVTAEALQVLGAMLVSAGDMAGDAGRGASARWTLRATSEVLQCEGFESVSPEAFEWLSEQVARAVAMLDEEIREAGERK